MARVSWTRVAGAAAGAGEQLDRVVVVLRVCWLCVVPRRWWVWWQGLVVVEYVMVWCSDVRYVGWVVRGAWLCWGVVGM